MVSVHGWLLLLATRLSLLGFYVVVVKYFSQRPPILELEMDFEFELGTSHTACKMLKLASKHYM